MLPTELKRMFWVWPPPPPPRPLAVAANQCDYWSLIPFLYLSIPEEDRVH